MFVNVVLPLPVRGFFTYSIPDSPCEEVVGRRVLVPWGKKKFQTAIVWRVVATDEVASDIQQLKNILCFLDDKPITTPHQMKLWEWIATYYMCTLGEVMRAALPNAFRLESETRISIKQTGEDNLKLTPLQVKILDLLSDGKVRTANEMSEKLASNVFPSLNRLLEMGCVQMEEVVVEKYREKTQKYIRLTESTHQEQLSSLIDSLKRSKKQQAFLLAFLNEVQDDLSQAISQKDFLEKYQFSTEVLKGLITKNVFRVEDKKVDRLASDVTTVCEEAHSLNDEQQVAYQNVLAQWKQKCVVLLHGVTSSGKTEVYIHLIKDCLEKGKNVLYLVPEIALTTQLTERLRSVFGDKLGVYHSRFSDSERVEIYRDCLARKSGKIWVGARSVILLPTENVDLIIVDEEHDASYKQQDPAPRYHARNAAIVLAQLMGAKVLLGSATPAIETYYNVETGKFGLVEMKHRYAGVQMPKVLLVDLKEQYQRKQMQGHFSDVLTNRIVNEMAKGKQTIVFQNRRGYARYIECSQCGYVAKCVNCDVTLTLHERSGVLSCHYCGYSIPIPSACPNCKCQNILDKGLGTEKVEDEVRTFFPSARVARMDLDTTRGKNAHQRLIRSLVNHEIDILVGTQMVTKGLHFDDVSTVAVLNADNLMNMPDFRAYETAYQMLEQVSGRAGRKGERGEVIIQTFSPDNPLLHCVQTHNYAPFYKMQIAERKLFKYPPFYRILSLVIRMRDAAMIDEVAFLLQSRLQMIFLSRCSRVITPQISRVQSLYIRNILLKIESEASYAKAKELLQEQINWLSTQPTGKKAQVYVDVDPL